MTGQTLRTLGRAVKWLGLLLVVAVVATDVWWETVGIPRLMSAALRRELSKRGVELEQGHAKLGLVNGLVIEAARMRLTAPRTPIRMECSRLQIRPRVASVIKGKPRLNSASFSGLSAAWLSDASSAAATERYGAPLQRGAGTVRPTSNGSLKVSLQGLFEKVRLTLEADIHGLDQLLSGTGPSVNETPTKTSGQTAPRLVDHVRGFQRRLAQLGLAERDAFLSGYLSVNVNRPETVAVNAEFGLADIYARGVILRKAKGRIAFRDGRLQLRDMMLFVGSDEVLQGSLTFQVKDPGKRESDLQGNLQGKLRPRTVWRFLGGQTPEAMAPLTFPFPATVSATIAASSVDPDDWTVTGGIVADHATFHGMTVRHLACDLAWRDQVLELTVKDARLGAALTSTRLEGTATWDVQANRMAGRAKAEIWPRDLLAGSGWAVTMPGLDSLQAGDPIMLEAALEPSPPNWRTWVGKARLTCARLLYAQRNVGPISAHLELDRGKLSVTDSRVGFPGLPEDVLCFSGNADLDAWPGDGPLAVNGRLTAKAPPVSADAGDADRMEPWEQALDLEGTLTYAFGDQDLNIQAKGTMFPRRLYDALQVPLGLPTSRIVRRIRSQGDPLRCAFSIRRTKRAPFLSLDGTVEGDDVVYNELALKTFSAEVSLRPQAVRVSNIRGITAAGDDIGLDIEVRFRPPSVRLSRGTLHGSPRVVATFIDDRNARSVYDAVWRDIEWDEATPPTIELESLIYRQPAPGVWHLSMDADLTMNQVAFRGVTASEFGANVVLDLPGQVAVRNARIRTETGRATGMVSIATGQIPKCAFEIANVEGGVEPRRVLHAINPEWDEWLDAFAFSQDSSFACQGSFYFSRDPRLKLAGSIESPYLDFRGLHLTQPVVKWTLDGTTVYWDLLSGRLFEGEASLTGTYDADTGQGLIAFAGDNMRLAGLAAYLGQEGDARKHPGLISAECRLQILSDWAGKETQLAGNGRLSITEADLWQVPLFNSLGKLLDVTLLSRLTGGKASSLGRISRLDADLRFNGDRIQIPSLTTDGTIISLKGNGEYAWESDRLHLSVTGEALRKVNVISLVFRPLSWVFAAELSGTSKDYSWRLATPLQKALSGSDHRDDAPGGE